MSERTSLFGKYRGTVLQNVDPLGLGRVQAIVPDATGPMPTSWAMPCFPVRGMFMVPPIGSGVWIEFEAGNRDHPIWSGCFYGSAAEVPASARAWPQAITLETATRAGIHVSDMPGGEGGVTIRSASGAVVRVNDTGIYLDNGKGATVRLVGASVDIGEGP